MLTASAAKLQAMVGALVVSTRPKASSASTAPSASASFVPSAPLVTGRWAVRLTCLSKSRSATSLTAQPALRMRKVPSTNTASRCQPGKPPAAIHKAARLGHSSRYVPAGRSQRIRLRYSASREGGAAADVVMPSLCDARAQNRILARAWLRVLWRAWVDRKPYDPALHGGLQTLLRPMRG